MKATELRVGNIVNISEDWYRRNPHLSKTPKQRIVDSINYDGLIGTSIYFANGYEIEDDLDPIPITEEWLLKFGFVYKSYGYGDSEWKQWWFNGYFINGFRCATSNVEIKSVNQLQNLYFALTGEELTFKSE